jgi:hypothetical protein
MQTTSVDAALCQISYGFRSRVSSYGGYDVNGYRFRSKEHEREKSGLATVNSGVCVSCVDDDNNETEYYGVIKDIIKIKWEGSLPLEMVLFDCDWFDPTPSGTKRTENLGLVEVKHAARLSVFEPFVMASQVKQVYYLPYACTKRPDLAEWWVVYQVSPRGYIPPYGISDDSTTSGPSQVQELSFFQEEGLDGTFVIDLNIELDNATPTVLDEITDPKDLEFLSKLNSAAEDMDDNTYEDDEEDQDEDDYDMTNHPAYDPNDY